MKKIVLIIDKISALTGKATSFLILVVVFIVVYEIVMRYVFHRPTIWASEAMVFGCAFGYVLGGAWTLLENRHVRIGVIYEKLPMRRRVILDIITFFFFALYMGMLFWASTKYAWESFEIRETAGSPWDPPVYPLKLALAFGILLLLVQGIAKFVRNIFFVIKGTEL